MTKKRLLIGFISAIVIIVATCFIVFEKNGNDIDSFEVDLYFLNENDTTIVAEHTTIQYDNDDKISDVVLRKLIDGPSNQSCHPIFERDTKILSTITSGTDMTVDFSKEYLTEIPAKNYLKTYAIVKTLCQLDDIDRVMVTVEGEEIVASDGTIVGLLSSDDIDLVNDSKTQDSKEITLYFADKNSDKLIEEKRTIKITDTVPCENYVVNELIKGTEKNNAKNVLTSDTELISTETSDGTCFVNFKSGFIEKNSGDAKAEKLTIYAIVNSLCSLKNVNFVQFLVDGKKIDSFGSIDLKGFFIENKDMIK